MKKKLFFLSTLLTLLFHTPLFGAPSQEVWITVFIHGIMSIKPHLTRANFVRFMKDEIEESIYAKTVEFMRMDQYFYLNQAMQAFDLIPLDINHLHKGAAYNAIAYMYETNAQAVATTPITNYYYTFGWSGLLSSLRRYLEAEKLFIALEKEVERFKQQGINAKVRLIGYSHGGNVALNLAAVKQNKYPCSSLSIDELILLGVPIQTETDYLVNDSIFKKIYNMFSPHDRIQQIDLFSFNRFLSRKTFINRHNFKVPDKLIQVELKITRLTHSCYNRHERLCQTLDFTNPAVISGTSPFLRNVSPGHIELWFFGWTPQHYRPHFALAPLPVLVMLPYVLHGLHNMEHLLANPYPVIADMRPEHEILLIKQYKPIRQVGLFPFATKQERKKLARLAKKVKPDRFTNEDYNQAIAQAHCKAIQFYQVNKSPIVGRGLHRPKRAIKVIKRRR